MTARWHLGPITGWSFWWLLVTSPEILIFLFFMITDPMTIPKGRVARVVYAVCVGLLATLLIAPQTTEYAHEGRGAGRARPGLCGTPAPRTSPSGRRLARGSRLAVGTRAHCDAAGSPPRALALAVGRFRGARGGGGHSGAPGCGGGELLPGSEPLPQVNVAATDGISARVDSVHRGSDRTRHRPGSPGQRGCAPATRPRSGRRAGAGGAWLVDLRQQIGAAAGGPISVSTYRVSSVDLTLTRGAGQAPPRILASVTGREQVGRLSRPAAEARASTRLRRPSSNPSRWLSNKATTSSSVSEEQRRRRRRLPAGVRRSFARTGPLADVRLQDVASAGRARLPPGRVPLRRLQRPGRDDGRGRLLARLRQRRLARPVRRQLVLRRRSSSLGEARRTAPQRALPQRQGARS